MINIGLVHCGPISALLPATSIIKGINKSSVKSNKIWIVQEKYKYLFKYSAEKAISFQEFLDTNLIFDILIDLWPDNLNIPENKYKKHMTFDEETGDLKEILLGKINENNISLFQLYFKLCGLVWAGEGYKIDYFPQTKFKDMKIGITGVSLVNANLRNYVWDNLKLDKEKIWYIPYKKNIFKRMNEINKCKSIITDDLITYHLSMALRKYVYFLQTYYLSFRLETFGRGEIIEIPSILL